MTAYRRWEEGIEEYTTRQGPRFRKRQSVPAPRPHCAGPETPGTHRGVHAPGVQRQMGHASIQVTVDVYGHLTESVCTPRVCEEGLRLVKSRKSLI